MTLQTPTISKRYGNHWVLRDVSLELQPGTVLALLGATGSGKTTLLKILANREQASTISNGVNWRAARLARFPEKSDGVLNRLFRRSDQLPDRGSALKRLLGSASGVLLLDDPLRELSDAEVEAQGTAIRKAARERELSVVYATSSFQTAVSVADRVAVIGKGTVLQTGTPEEVYDSPLTPDIARLTGRCNVFEARRLTSSKSDSPEFQTIQGEHRLFTEKADVAKLGPINRDVPLAIRPENVVISFGASFPEDNLVKATVTGTRFLGPTTIVELNAGGLELEAMVFRVVGLSVGEECMVALPPDRIRILAG